MYAFDVTTASAAYTLQSLSPKKVKPTAPPANSNTSGCLEVLKGCDAALKAREAHATSQAQVITKQDDLLKKQVERINSLEESKNAWYNNKTLWLGIGFLVGGHIVHKWKP